MLNDENNPNSPIQRSSDRGWQRWWRFSSAAV